ncbi:MAG: succinate dehydrogenase, cytochrome b556 subunit [Caulobacteraceae bacterium]
MSNTPVRERPLSPHTTIWRWHIQTMAASILHRITGLGLYVGALLLAGWAVALASGPEAYAGYMGLLASPLGRIVLFGLTVCLFYHTINGIRHLVWDTGAALDIKSADASGWLSLILSPLAAIAVWVFAGMTGAL